MLFIDRNCVMCYRVGFGCIVYDTVGSVVVHWSSFPWHQQSFDLLLWSRTAFLKRRKVQYGGQLYRLLYVFWHTLVCNTFQVTLHGFSCTAIRAQGVSTVRGRTVLLRLTTCKITIVAQAAVPIWHMLVLYPCVKSEIQQVQVWKRGVWHLPTLSERRQCCKICLAFENKVLVGKG